MEGGIFMGKCPLCGGELIWNSDFTFEDYALEGEGIVSVWMCAECRALGEFYVSEEGEY